MARKNETRSAFGDRRQKLRLDRATACALTPKEQAMLRTVLAPGWVSGPFAGLSRVTLCLPPSCR